MGWIPSRRSELRPPYLNGARSRTMVETCAEAFRVCLFSRFVVVQLFYLAKIQVGETGWRVPPSV